MQDAALLFPTPRILVLLQLAASGERERLKSLLRDRLVECGWKEDVTRHARGALLSAVFSICFVSVPVSASSRPWQGGKEGGGAATLQAAQLWPGMLSCRCSCLIHDAAADCSSTARHQPTRLSDSTRRLQEVHLLSTAEFVAGSKGHKVTADDIVAAIRTRGRQRVPDHVKAELLTELRSSILKQ